MVQEKNERRSNLFPERNVTALRHQGLRQALIAAAERLIEDHGLAALRARELANAAGCSLGAIYNVFADLDELILEVNANTLRAMDAAMAEIAPGSPAAQFLALAEAYLNYAAQHRRRWDALFSHRLPEGRVAPDWFLAVQGAAFSHIEAPLACLRPDLPAVALSLLGRGIFAAVHGMVALGLDQRVAPTEPPVLRAQIALVVAAIARGLPGEESSYLFEKK
jgi:AcrR family transcriptional regulator